MESARQVLLILSSQTVHKIASKRGMTRSNLPFAAIRDGATKERRFLFLKPTSESMRRQITGFKSIDD